MNKKILDIGADVNPDKRATDAIDNLMSPADIKRAESKSKKLERYFIGDFRHPPKEAKQAFDTIVSHFADDAFIGKSGSKALDYVTKENATAEIETDLSNAPKVVQALHDANFRVLSVEAKETPSVVPMRGDVVGRVIIKAVKSKRTEAKSFYASPIKVKLSHRKGQKKIKKTRHSTSKHILLRTARIG